MTCAQNGSMADAYTDEIKEVFDKRPAMQNSHVLLVQCNLAISLPEEYKTHNTKMLITMTIIL